MPPLEAIVGTLLDHGGRLPLATELPIASTFIINQHMNQAACPSPPSCL